MLGGMEEEDEKVNYYQKKKTVRTPIHCPFFID
jgi:hypothetical protein